MKKLLMVIAMALAGTLVAQDKAMTLADARGKIGDVIADPASITAVMKQLSAADQTAYLAEVNAAISKMPGSTDEKTQKFLDVDTAALKGAKEGNLTTLLAEVFATVPPNSLTVINERFAADMFNRKADPSKTYTDEQYTAIAKNVLGKVQDRTATADNAGVRDTFAILMLVRASEGSPADLRDTLVNELRDPATKELAQNEWISPALGQGQEKTYDPMLGAADAGDQPDLSIALTVPSTLALDALAGDLATSGSLGDTSSSLTEKISPILDDPMDPILSSELTGSGVAGGLSRLPRTGDPVMPYNPSYKRGGSDMPKGPFPQPVPPEPGPYPGQWIWRH
jgi:hypothetical protein